MLATTLKRGPAILSSEVGERSQPITNKAAGMNRSLRQLSRIALIRRLLRDFCIHGPRTKSAARGGAPLEPPTMLLLYLPELGARNGANLMLPRPAAHAAK